MIKQNGYLENLLVFQNALTPSLAPITGFQDSHIFACQDEGRMLVVRVCGGRRVIN